MQAARAIHRTAGKLLTTLTWSPGCRLPTMLMARWILSAWTNTLKRAVPLRITIETFIMRDPLPSVPLASF